jgi:predicted SAM-dependent methyltransferase
MEKLHVGAGPNRLPGWRNHDRDMDLRKPLPLQDGSIQFLFAEHVVEHITPAEAWQFFKEVRRVLRPGGVARVAVPCVDLVAARYDATYADFLRTRVGGDGTREDAINSIICNWGHKAIWTVAALRAVLESLGFQTTEEQSGHSLHPELNGIDRHARRIGEHANWVETGVVEAVKAR